jgi:thymidylate kinase
MSVKVINLFAGPGAGKSTISAEIFSKLKRMRKDVELITEFAKDVVWENRLTTLKNQVYVFAEQQHRVWRVAQHFESKGLNGYVVTDSPFLLSVFYHPELTNEFINFVLKEFNKFDNLNVFVKRTKQYNPFGRMQTEEEAMRIDQNIKEFLNNYKIAYIELVDNGSIAEKVIELIEKQEEIMCKCNQEQAVSKMTEIEKKRKRKVIGKTKNFK